MTTEEIKSFRNELANELQRIEERISLKLRARHGWEDFVVHVSSLRMIPSRLEKALRVFNTSRAFPPMKFQDELNLRQRTELATTVLSEALRRDYEKNLRSALNGVLDDPRCPK